MPHPTVTTIADGVDQVQGSRTNVYVIADGGRVTLVDTGYPGDRDLLVEALGRLGHTPGAIEHVVVTHGHVDHIGSAEWLRGTHHAAVHAHRLEEPNLTGERDERISTRDILVRLLDPKMRSFVANVVRARFFALDAVAEVETYDDGVALDVPGQPVPVFTPGHTSGHCAFHIPERGVLLSGDALVTEDSLTRETGPRLISAVFNHDHAMAAESLAVLADLDADVIGPGHGEPLRVSPVEAVERAQALLG